jgi:adenosine deaminase
MAEYFRPWLVFKRLPKGRACLQQITRAALEALADDNVVYAELRNSPFYIADINNLSIQEAVAWLIEDVQTASEEMRIEARLIISLSRFNFDVEKATSLLQSIARENDGTIVGLDLSGNEDQPIPSETSRIFRSAKDEFGLGISVHAGETGNPQTIRWAIEECRTDRIAHALAAADDPELMDKVVEQGICVEVCLTSNYLTGQVPDLRQHPVIRFIKHGIQFVLCSDNPSVNVSPLSNEYSKFVEISDRYDLIASMDSNQKRFSFA